MRTAVRLRRTAPGYGRKGADVPADQSGDIEPAVSPRSCPPYRYTYSLGSPKSPAAVDPVQDIKLRQAVRWEL